VTFSGSTATLKAGQWFAIVSPGAGAFGPAAARPAEQVARDVAEGVISAGRAEEAYTFNA
jgi:N-methylhydantoinase B